MSVSHQSCPLLFPVILTKMDYFSKNVVSEQMGKSDLFIRNDCQGAPYLLLKKFSHTLKASDEHEYKNNQIFKLNGSHILFVFVYVVFP